MTDLLPGGPETVGHRLKKQEAMPESPFSGKPLAVRPLEPTLGRWVFPSVRRSSKTTDSPTDSDRLRRPAHAPLPNRSKTSQNVGHSSAIRPHQRCDDHHVSYEAFHMLLVYCRTRRRTVGAEDSLGGLECRSCSCFVSPTLVESGQICLNRKGSQSRFCFHDCSQPILEYVGSHDSR